MTKLTLDRLQSKLYSHLQSDLFEEGIIPQSYIITQGNHEILIVLQENDKWLLDIKLKSSNSIIYHNESILTGSQIGEALSRFNLDIAKLFEEE